MNHLVRHIPTVAKPKIKRPKMARRISRKNAFATAWHDKLMSEQKPKKKNATGAAKQAKKRKAYLASIKETTDARAAVKGIHAILGHDTASE